MNLKHLLRSLENNSQSRNIEKNVLLHYITSGFSPSSSDITINESVSSKLRGSDLGIGFITCSDIKHEKRLKKLSFLNQILNKN